MAKKSDKPAAPAAGDAKKGAAKKAGAGRRKPKQSYSTYIYKVRG
jgi:hypothetical protein